MRMISIILIYEKIAEVLKSDVIYLLHSLKPVDIHERVKLLQRNTSLFSVILTIPLLPTAQPELTIRKLVDRLQRRPPATHKVSTLNDSIMVSDGAVFPVDTHVHRIARRMGLAPADADHETVREHLEADVPGEKCGFGHTAMIQFGREYCTARKPACLDGPEACPLYDLCDRVGVDEVGESVVDPAESATN